MFPQTQANEFRVEHEKAVWEKSICHRKGNILGIQRMDQNLTNWATVTFRS
ncbi:hypothetical protein ACCUM_1230 [Candidatus Accumulibacter phosphatis]|uniref:Uncharacterized protein n=1 Tax=Candidatus Accumulibacter phosphatis TaxID=327160 RepID=A0A5S4EJN8_9PROT|nr:hypothetical protein ACCUM_1230 [Candidatus Accumulibacter phosphatis]